MMVTEAYLKKHPHVFSKQWFQKYQWLLLFFVNTDFGKDILQIPESQYRKCKVVKVGPQFVTVQAGNKNVVIIKSRPIFANNIAKAGREAWKALHWFDTKLANRFAPAWNLGFDTMDFSPDAGVGGGSVDGTVYHFNSSWATCRGAATGQTPSPSASYVSVQDRFSSPNYYIYRGFLTFDTSSLDSEDTITGVTLKLFCHAKAEYDTTTIYVVANSQASYNGLFNFDYGSLGATGFGSIAYADITTSAYNSISLDANGIAEIDPDGITYFGLRNYGDLTNVAPTGASNGVAWRSADYAGSYEPILTVEYSVGGGSTAKRGMLI